MKRGNLVESEKKKCGGIWRKVKEKHKKRRLPVSEFHVFST
ncbi:hypothetical protein [Halobacillus sp. B23F22_1]